MTAAADLVGLGVAAAASIGWVAGAPSTAPALSTLVDTQPRLRGLLERRLGRETADALIGCTNAMLQGAAGATPALLVDLTARGMATAEAQANRAAWGRHEPQLAAYAVCPDIGAPSRPRPRPAGLVDRYADLSAASGLLAAATLAATGRPRLAASCVMASAPKATRYAQQAFTSSVGRLLCERADGLLLRGQALGLLGNVDSIVIDPQVLVTESATVSEIREASGIARDKLWMAATEEVNEGTIEAGWHGITALSPTRDTSGIPPHATFLVTRVAEPLALEVLDAARSAGLVCGSLDLDWLGPLRSFFDELQTVDVPSGHPRGTNADRGEESAALATLVARLQVEGRTVLVLGAAEASVAMPAADIAVGVGEQPAWTADVLVPELGAAWRLINAIPVARTVNRRSVELSVGGTVLEALLLLSPRQRRLPGPVMTAGALAVLMGWRAGTEVMSRRMPAVVPQHSWHGMTPAQVCRLLPERFDRSIQQDAPSGPGDPEGGGDPGEHWTYTAVKAAKRVVSVVREDLDDPMSPVLATGAGASAILGSPGDAALVSSVMFGNAILSGVQRLRAEQVLNRLLTSNDTPARVLLAKAPCADGMPDTDVAYVDVPSERLRLGEVVEVRAGEIVPADGRILTADAVEVDESALTGESLPVRKSVEATPGAPLAERTCMLYEGTVVLTGTAVVVVTASGAATESGRALALSPSRSRDVGLSAQLSRLTGSVLPLTLAGGLGVSGLGLLRGTALRDAVASGVAIGVAAVPEGLPLIATLAQQAAARRLAAAGVLVRTPAAIEALGRVRTICFDKTGTLTENRLTVKVAHPCPTVRESSLQTAAALASPSNCGPESHTQSTDAAVARYGTGHRPRSEAQLPFRSGRPYSAGLSGDLLAVKGAPETVLAACGTSTAEWPQVEGFAARGLRVLAVAQRRLTDKEVKQARGDTQALERLASEKLTLLGFLGISDTVRSGAKELLGDLQHRGVRPVLITGDHPVTAAAVLADLGLEVSPPQMLTGDQWAALSRRQRDDAVRRTTVYARMSPEQKVQVVQSLERAGVASAMVGDGANDAAAIRAATVGIGVSTSGSDPARGAADVVLLDGQIELLTAGLDEGAQLWRSVQAAVAMLLGGNAGEVAFTALGVALSGRAPMNARQLLLVNLLTDALPAAALAVSTTPGREADNHRGLDEDELWRQVIVRGATTTIGATSAWGLARLTGRPTRASTVGLVALVATQLAQTIVDAPTPLVVATATGSLAALALAINTPGVSQSLGCTPLGPLAWAQALGCATTATMLATFTPAFRQRIQQIADSEQTSHPQPRPVEPSGDVTAAAEPPSAGAHVPANHPQSEVTPDASQAAAKQPPPARARGASTGRTRSTSRAAAADSPQARRSATIPLPQRRSKNGDNHGRQQGQRKQ